MLEEIARDLKYRLEILDNFDAKWLNYDKNYVYALNSIGVSS
jgi:hypothetical protein